MNFSVWRLWPWISLFVYFALVKGLFYLTRGRGLVMYSSTPDERPRSDGIFYLLLLSVIVGAAVCVLLDYWLNEGLIPFLN